MEPVEHCAFEGRVYQTPSSVYPANTLVTWQPDPFRSRGLPFTDLRNGSAYSLRNCLWTGLDGEPLPITFDTETFSPPSPRDDPVVASGPLAGRRAAHRAAGTGKHTCAFFASALFASTRFQ